MYSSILLSFRRIWPSILSVFFLLSISLVLTYSSVLLIYFTRSNVLYVFCYRGHTAMFQSHQLHVVDLGRSYAVTVIKCVSRVLHMLGICPITSTIIPSPRCHEFIFYFVQNGSLYINTLTIFHPIPH